VREHLARARLLLRLANEQSDANDAFRLRIESINNCRAIIELFLEAAEQQELVGYKSADRKASRSQYESTLLSLPHYSLIERMRVHDFHRFGLVPPDADRISVFVGGPIKLSAQRGGAQVALTGAGLTISTTGNSRVDLQRPLVTQDGMFLDEALGKLLAPQAIAEAFLRAVTPKIEEFEHQIG
jgi:hypothetical protein